MFALVVIAVGIDAAFGQGAPLPWLIGPPTLKGNAQLPLQPPQPPQQPVRPIAPAVDSFNPPPAAIQPAGPRRGFPVVILTPSPSDSGSTQTTTIASSTASVVTIKERIPPKTEAPKTEAPFTDAPAPAPAVTGTGPTPIPIWVKRCSTSSQCKPCGQHSTSCEKTQCTCFDNHCFAQEFANCQSPAVEHRGCEKNALESCKRDGPAAPCKTNLDCAPCSNNFSVLSSACLNGQCVCFAGSCFAENYANCALPSISSQGECASSAIVACNFGRLGR